MDFDVISKQKLYNRGKDNVVSCYQVINNIIDLTTVKIRKYHLTITRARQ